MRLLYYYNTMIRSVCNSLSIAIALVCLCTILSSCATVQEIQEGNLAKTLGSFELNPVQPNCYWYDGESYDYNSYQIQIASSPCRAHIIWDGQFIGDAPFTYCFTGTLDKDSYITVRAVPFDESFQQQEASLRIREELPRKINFRLLKKTK